MEGRPLYPEKERLQKTTHTEPPRSHRYLPRTTGATGQSAGAIGSTKKETGRMDPAKEFRNRKHRSHLTKNNQSTKQVVKFNDSHLMISTTGTARTPKRAWALKREQRVSLPDYSTKWCKLRHNPNTRPKPKCKSDQQNQEHLRSRQRGQCR